uniref:DUF1279 domain-containing protein n=1 Tax=Amphora coffeiformis TaxID=265554 RepID=A0A7S3LDI8_9STRA|mmetsp:Transcript_9061/g.17281  ORF Transcript_9061/g.17281 Transcript_9061/m.17281 type:complete len:181 (+) Transcript_9061:68-610(+)|eukprot:scaffold4484_cov170-Amphora_coffeaeformis.AAC.5
MKLPATVICALLASAAAFAPMKTPTTKVAHIVGRTQLFARNEVSTAVLEREATESVATINTTVAVEQKDERAEQLSETQKLMKQVKEAGTAGVISYALWELGFWALSVPVVLFGYVSVTGHFPDLTDKEDVAKLGAEAFAFVNFARFAVPLRIGLALSTTPWIQNNVVDRFFSEETKKTD